MNEHLQTTTALEPFVKLRDPSAYTTAEWDLLADADDLAVWIAVFIEHTASLLDHARTSLAPPPEAALRAYQDAFLKLLGEVRTEPAKFAPLSIYTLCRLRAEMMREYGIGDPYDRVKRDENDAAVARLPYVLAALESRADGQVVETLLRGVLAGNKFDLGAKETVDLHANGGIDFFETLGSLTPRPWFIDDVDEIAARLAPGRVAYRCAVYFVDNAGGDVVLGAIPFARYLADNGCRVVLAANDQPALNDILVGELKDVLARAARDDARLAEQVASGRIEVVPTGCDCPLIDLGAVLPQCNAAAADADLLILEGMGRAVETNWETPFTCDTIHLAMIKNRHVAAHVGCRLYDLIARFTPAS